MGYERTIRNNAGTRRVRAGGTPLAPVHASAAYVLALQRTAGNRAVAALLESRQRVQRQAAAAEKEYEPAPAGELWVPPAGAVEDPGREPAPAGVLDTNYEPPPAGVEPSPAGEPYPKKPKAAAHASGGRIAALNLAPRAQAAAEALLQAHPDVVFTSGRRGMDAQSRAMAGNVVKQRNYVQVTYRTYHPVEAAELQAWVDANPTAATKADIAAGLAAVMSGWDERRQSGFSLHYTGRAFDVQPVDGPHGDEIMATCNSLPGTRFLDHEGKLKIWHVEVQRLTRRAGGATAVQRERTGAEAGPEPAPPVDETGPAREAATKAGALWMPPAASGATGLGPEPAPAELAARPDKSATEREAATKAGKLWTPPTSEAPKREYPPSGEDWPLVRRRDVDVSQYEKREAAREALAAAKGKPTAAEWYKDIVHISFMGIPIKHGVHIELATRLRQAERTLAKFTAEDVGLDPEQSTSGLRECSTKKEGIGLHQLGLAVDFNIERNPYLGNHKIPIKDADGKVTGHRQPAYEVIARASLLVNGEKDDLSKTRGDEMTTFHRLTASSDALVKYLALSKDDVAERVAVLAKAGKNLKGYDAERWVRQIAEDRELLAKGEGYGTDFVHNKPTKGFIDLKQPLVEALVGAGLTWLGHDFPNVGRDVQHFDLRTGSVKKKYNVDKKRLESLL